MSDDEISFDPITKIAEIEKDAIEIDKAGRALAQATRNFGRVALSYEEERAKVTLALTVEEEKPPAKHILDAAVVDRIDAEIREAYFVEKAKIEALEGFLRAKRATISARQSQLAALREEAKMPNLQPEGEESWRN